MPASDDDRTPLDEVLERLQTRAADEGIETKDLCDIAKVFLAAEKAEADAIAKALGSRGNSYVPQDKLNKTMGLLESEEPQPLFDRDHDA
jgi:hypothetical protein